MEQLTDEQIRLLTTSHMQTMTVERELYLQTIMPWSCYFEEGLENIKNFDSLNLQTLVELIWSFEHVLEEYRGFRALLGYGAEFSTPAKRIEIKYFELKKLFKQKVQSKPNFCKRK